jgi:hypothetical protein
MAADQGAIEESVRTIPAQLNYLLPGPDINRRFVSAGVEVNTGSYGLFTVTMRDARAIAGHFTLDRHGFTLLDAPSAVADFTDSDAVDRLYPEEVARYVQRATGADLVVPHGWMIRTSGDLVSRQKKTDAPYQHRGGVQPPAGEVHVDTDPARQMRAAEASYRKARPDGPGFRRFIVSSFWRTYSPPPQDCPLALCDGRSVRDDEGTPNILWIVDEIPQGAAMFEPMDDESRPAAHIFRHSPDHRWWYFSNMARDEALLFKFHDSDRTGAWRVPHTAFWDDSLPGAQPRESIECRSIAFFE